MHFFRQKVGRSPNIPMHSPSHGFTLIEVMITVAIVGILAAVALPSYRDYVIRGYIPDAITNLAAKRVVMEQYFQDNKTYVNITGATGLSHPCNTDTSSSKYFNFSCINTLDVSNYTLQAEGKGTMTGFTYTVDQSNVKSTVISGVSGWNATKPCWVTNKGGAC